MDGLSSVRPLQQSPRPAPAGAPGASGSPETASGPDLVIVDMAFQPSSPRAGQEGTLVVTVGNTGNQAAGPFEVKVEEDVKGTRRLDKGLAPNAQAQLRFGPVRVGSFDQMLTVGCTIDSRDEVAETSEDNNWQYLMVPVDNPTNPWPPTPPLPPPPIPPIPPQVPRVMLAETERPPA